MHITRCAVCKKPAYTNSVMGKKEKKWLCPACKKKFHEKTLTVQDPQVGEICRKCKKKNIGQCRFSAYQRQSITACSDYEGKNTEHEKRRWAKFETEES